MTDRRAYRFLTDGTNTGETIDNSSWVAFLVNDGTYPVAHRPALVRQLRRRALLLRARPRPRGLPPGIASVRTSAASASTGWPTTPSRTPTTSATRSSAPSITSTGTGRSSTPPTSASRSRGSRTTRPPATCSPSRTIRSAEGSDVYVLDARNGYAETGAFDITDGGVAGDHGIRLRRPRDRLRRKSLADRLSDGDDLRGGVRGDRRLRRLRRPVALGGSGVRESSGPPLSTGRRARFR